MITFVVQNETHALNFAPIIQELQHLGVPEERLQILHLDKIYGLSTYDLISVPNQIMVDLKIPSPYYDLNQLKRFQWLLNTKYKIKEYLQNTNVLIFGSDGGIQRLMANIVRKEQGKVILLVDGLLHPWPKTKRQYYIIKRNINRLFAGIGLNYLLPADIGHSNLDYIYVMHAIVKDILISQGVKTPIGVITLPRYDSYIADYSKLKESITKAETQNCLYITGSFKWHGLLEEDQQQKEDITDLVFFAETHGDWRIRIRIHPRESTEDYISRKWPPNIELSIGSNRPVLEDLVWASVLVTGRSTVAYEAELVGIPVLIYTRNFGSPHPESFFQKNIYFDKSNYLEDICNIKPKFHQIKTVQSSKTEIALRIKQYFDDYTI